VEPTQRFSVESTVRDAVPQPVWPLSRFSLSLRGRAPIRINVEAEPHIPHFSGLIWRDLSGGWFRAGGVGVGAGGAFKEV
jgi:hypothetical protein